MTSLPSVSMYPQTFPILTGARPSENFPTLSNWGLMATLPALVMNPYFPLCRMGNNDDPFDAQEINQPHCARAKPISIFGEADIKIFSYLQSVAILAPQLLTTAVRSPNDKNKAFDNRRRRRSGNRYHYWLGEKAGKHRAAVLLCKSGGWRRAHKYLSAWK